MLKNQWEEVRLAALTDSEDMRIENQNLVNRLNVINNEKNMLQEHKDHMLSEYNDIQVANKEYENKVLMEKVNFDNLNMHFQLTHQQNDSNKLQLEKCNLEISQNIEEIELLRNENDDFREKIEQLSEEILEKNKLNELKTAKISEIEN